MELRSLRYFATMADELHFGRAARRLYITQPGLSQGIKALERKIGVRLFERHRQEVTLTKAGQTLLPTVRQLLAQAEELDRLAGHLATAQRGVLRLSHSRSAGVGLPSVLTNQFRRVHPEISLHTLSGSTSLNVERVRSREVDLGFVYPPLDLTDELADSVLAWEPVVLAVPAGHRLARQPAVPHTELTGEPLVFFSNRSGGLWKSVLDAVYGPDEQPKITRVEPDEPHMLAAVAEHAGVGLLTESSAAILNVPGVTIRSFADSVTVPLGVVWRQDNINPALRVYLELAGSAAGRAAVSGTRADVTRVRVSA